MIICIHPREVRSIWAPQSIPTGDPHAQGGGPDSIDSGSVNPGGVGGNSLCTSTITPELMASSGSEASSGQLGVCRLVAHSWGSGS